MARSKPFSRGPETAANHRKVKVYRHLWRYYLFYGVLASSLVVGAIYGYRTLHHHPRFTIRTIQIQGASPAVSRELYEELQELVGRNIFSLNLRELQHRVEQHPWVGSVAVESHLPDRIGLVVSETQPSGLIKHKQGVSLVDQEGLVICPLEEYSRALDVPVLLGTERYENEAEVIRQGLETLQKIRETSPLFWDNIETLDLSDPENMIVRLRSLTAPVYLGDQLIPANLTNFLSIAKHVQEHYPELVYIELGFPNQVAIMPRKK